VCYITTDFLATTKASGHHVFILSLHRLQRFVGDASTAMRQGRGCMAPGNSV